MPVVWSQIDNVTKNIVNGWLRIQQHNLNINVPTSLNGLCIEFYCIKEMFHIKTDFDYFQEFGITMNLSKHKRYVSLVTFKKNCYWQCVYGINQILLNNIYCKYIYSWILKIHKLNTNSTYKQEHPFIYIGLSKGTYGYDSTKKYCSNGSIKAFGYLQKATKYGQGFGENDEVSVLLNSWTTELFLTVNGCRQKQSFKLHTDKKERKVKLGILMNGPNIEIELIKFDCKKI